MLKLDEKQKMREYDLQLKNDYGLNNLLPIVNKLILSEAYCILTYHKDINLLRIKIYDAEDPSKFSDVKVSCKLKPCKEVDNILTLGNSVMSMHGILQFFLKENHILHIDMYKPEDSVLSNRLFQIANAIK